MIISLLKTQLKLNVKINNSEAVPNATDTIKCFNAKKENLNEAFTSNLSLVTNKLGRIIQLKKLFKNI